MEWDRKTKNEELEDVITVLLIGESRCVKTNQGGKDKRSLQCFDLTIHQYSVTFNWWALGCNEQPMKGGGEQVHSNQSDHEMACLC